MRWEVNKGRKEDRSREDKIEEGEMTEKDAETSSRREVDVWERVDNKRDKDRQNGEGKQRTDGAPGSSTEKMPTKTEGTIERP